MSLALISQAKRLFWHTHQGVLPIAWFLTDLNQCPHPEAVIPTLPEDVGVIIRDYDHPQRSTYAEDLVAIAHAYNHPVLIGADVDLALSLNANGVHWPRWACVETDHPLFQSFAVHNDKERQRAKTLHADALLISPVFKTKSHTDGKTLGVSGLKHLSKHHTIPSYALGGVNANTLHRLRNVPLAGFAGIGCFL